MSKSVLGWYFAPSDKKLKHGDKRLIHVGGTHTVQGQIELCYFGLHASIRPLDALGYASSAIVFRVRLGGTIVKGTDKCVATERTYLAELDASVVLSEFARKCAARVLHLWDAPQVVKDWLTTGDSTLRSAAESAAWSAADSAARSAARSAAASAAWSAAASAAWSAAGSAAESAARSAADSAAWSAAESVAWSAAWSARNKELEAMLQKALKG